MVSLLTDCRPTGLNPSGHSERSHNSNSHPLLGAKPLFTLSEFSHMKSLSPSRTHTPQFAPFPDADISCDPDSAFYDTTFLPSRTPPKPTSLRPLGTSHTTRDHMSFLDIDPRAVIAVLLDDPDCDLPKQTHSPFAPGQSQKVLDENLVRSLRNAAVPDKQLLLRVANAADSLKNWCEELHQWHWKGSFCSGLIGRFSSSPFVDNLPTELCTRYENRVAELTTGLDRLDLDSAKEPILSLFTPSLSIDSGTDKKCLPNGSTPSGTQVSFIEDVSLLATHFMMVSLPLRNELKQMLSCWRARLDVLRRSPSFLRNLELGYSYMKQADASLHTFSDYVHNLFASDGSGLCAEETRHHTQILGDMDSLLRSLLEDLGSTLDFMLDRVEWMGEPLPNSWIVEFESLESQYNNWISFFEALRLRVSLWSPSRSEVSQVAPAVAESFSPLSSDSSRLVSFSSPLSTSSCATATDSTGANSGAVTHSKTTVVIRIINQAPTLVNVTSAWDSSSPSGATQAPQSAVTQDEYSTREPTVVEKGSGHVGDGLVAPDTQDIRPDYDGGSLSSQTLKVDVKTSTRSRSAFDTGVTATTQCDMATPGPSALDGSSATSSPKDNSAFFRYPSVTSHSSVSYCGESNSPSFPLPSVLGPLENGEISLTQSPTADNCSTDSSWEDDDDGPSVSDYMLTPQKRLSARTSSVSSSSFSPSSKAPISIKLPRARGKVVSNNWSVTRPPSLSLPANGSPISPKTVRVAKPGSAVDLNERISSILGQIRGEYDFQLSPRSGKSATPLTPTKTLTPTTLRGCRGSSRSATIPLRHKGSRVQSLAASYHGGESARSPSDSSNVQPRTPQLGLSGQARSSFTLVPDTQMRRQVSHSFLREGLLFSGQKRTVSSSGTKSGGMSSVCVPTSSPSGRSGSQIRLYHLFFPEDGESDGHGAKRKSKQLYIRQTDEGRVLVRVGGGWADLADWLKTFIEHHCHRKARADGAAEEAKSCLAVATAGGSAHREDGCVDEERDSEPEDLLPFASLDSVVGSITPRAISPAPSSFGGSASACGTLGRRTSRSRLDFSASGRRTVSNSLGSPITVGSGFECSGPKASLAGPGFDRTRGAVPLSEENKQWVNEMVASVAGGSGGGSSSGHREGLPGLGFSSPGPDGIRERDGAGAGAGTGAGLGLGDGVNLGDIGTVGSVRRLARVPRKGIL